MASDMPACPRPGHEAHYVVKAGTYGKRKRQLFRCNAPDGSFHRFVPAVPRQRVEDGVCEMCDNHIHVHQGPVVQRRGLYEVREIAEALHDIASGRTYTEAARRARGRYWGAGGKGTRKASSVEGGQTVAEWLHQFGLVIAEPWAETEWPECIVLDSTEFMYSYPRGGGRQQLFVVLAAWGYPVGGGPGRLWRLDARPADTNTDWCEFLEALPGRPRSVVCDRDFAIIGGVQQHWGKGRAGVPIHLCEHHLWKNGMAALREDGLAIFGDPLPTLLADAFETPAGWDAYVAAVDADRTAVAAHQWVHHWNRRMKAQTARRASLPPHYGNGAIEPALGRVRALLDKRKWTFRNQARMNLLLELVRLRINRNDDVVKWAALIRAHIDEHNGQSDWERRMADEMVYNPTEKQWERYSSLRGQ